MIWEALIDFVYPKMCVGCGEWGSFLCKVCRDRLDFVDQICPMCGEETPMGWTHSRCKSKYGMDGLIALYEYKEPVMRSVIDGIKYGFNRDLVQIVLENFQFETGVKFDYLVPIPLHRYRENWRGFNQAEEIAQVIGARLLVSCARILKRIRNTKQQVTMKTKEDREENIKGAFALDLTSSRLRGAGLRGKKVLLVDDVFTSGADMREGTKILKKAGVKVVWGLTLAH